MLRVVMADQGSIEELRDSLRAIVDQASAQRDLFVANASMMLDGGSYPERRHVLTLANTFMIGHFTHIIEWATWALDEIADWPDTVTPATTEWDRSRAILQGVAALAVSTVPGAGPDPGHN